MKERVRCKWCRVPLVLILGNTPEVRSDGKLIVHALCPACDFVPAGGPPANVAAQP